MKKVVIIIIVIVILIIAGFLVYQNFFIAERETDLKTKCCEECGEAFGKSPISVGAEMAQCGEFSTAQPLSEECKTYFQNNLMSVSECRKAFISEKPLSNMKIKSIFLNNTKIPSKYTCDGEDVSPPLEISEIPKGTNTLAIISDDPDAPMGTWVHWLVWNLGVPEGMTSKKIEEATKVGIQGKNDFKKLGYGGPCPPSGTHRYFFKVYALDIDLDLAEGSTKAQLESAMQNHILEKAELIGLYSKG